MIRLSAYKYAFFTWCVGVLLLGCMSPAELSKTQEEYRGLPYHAPTSQIPPAGVHKVSASDLTLLMESSESILLLDVYGAIFREESLDFDGAWLVSTPRKNIPGSVWLPNVGKQALVPIMERYFADNLVELTHKNKAQPIVFYCIEDCWMAWKAAKRAYEWGYIDVMGFLEVLDGWKYNNGPLTDSEPVNLPLND